MKSGDYFLVVAPEDYPGKKYRDKYCYLHHLVYWMYTGIVPSDNQIIHHKDGNKENNSFENLCLMDRNVHTIYHNICRQKTMISLICSFCGKIFHLEKRQIMYKNNKYCYCSKECMKSAFKLNKDKKEDSLIPKTIVEEYKLISPIFFIKQPKG